MSLKWPPIASITTPALARNSATTTSLSSVMLVCCLPIESIPFQRTVIGEAHRGSHAATASMTLCGEPVVRISVRRSPAAVSSASYSSRERSWPSLAASMFISINALKPRSPSGPTTISTIAILRPGVIASRPRRAASD